VLEDKILVLDCDVGFDGKDAEWIAQNFRSSYEIFAVRKHIFPRSPDRYGSIVITGSSASANDNEEWIKNLIGFMQRSYRYRIPTLGICFGHQIIAKSLGGTIKKMDDVEVGWYKINHKGDGLFHGTDSPMYVFQSHTEMVCSYPKGAECISWNSVKQGFQMKERPIYGVQFHPEIDFDIATTVLEARKDKVEKLTGKRIGELNCAAVQGGYNASRIITNFEEIAKNYNRTYGNSRADG
jgi:GMP synthase (glutamine-hydrolysing)